MLDGPEEFRGVEVKSGMITTIGPVMFDVDPTASARVQAHLRGGAGVGGAQRVEDIGQVGDGGAGAAAATGGRGAGLLLGDQRLLAVGCDAHHAAAGIGRPQRAVAFGQDALRALQVLADGADAGAVHLPAHQGVLLCCCHVNAC